MPYRITSNKKNASIVIHASANSGNVIIVGNSSVSNICADNTEIIVGATISQIIGGAPSGNSAYWIVKRGANVVSVVDSSAMIDYAGSGLGLTLDPTANLSLELVGSTDGAIMIELQKKTSTSDYYTQSGTP